MKYLVLLSYLLTISGSILYFYYRIGFLKMLATMTLEDLNKEQEFAEEKLDEDDIRVIRNFFITAFSFLGVYLWALMGTTFGAIAKEMATSPTLEWILYPILFIVMRVAFGMAHKMMRTRFEIDKIPEQVFFSLFMMVFFVLSIGWPEWVSGIFSWPVKLVL